MKQSKKVFQLGELFSGPGGLGLGAAMASQLMARSGISIEHRWAIDYHADACATYRRNIVPDSPERVICDDIRSVPVAKLPRIDALAFGFPCNDFSLVGEKLGLRGSFGPLYTYGVRAIEAHRPEWFVAENVGGLQSANDGKAFKKILGDLRAAGEGYELTPHFYRFEHYGVPQTRHRILIVGIRRDLGLHFRVPAPTHRLRPVTAREALEHPPIPKDAPNHDRTRQGSIVVERLKHIRPGENAWTADIPKKLQLNVRGAKMSHIYRRLNPDAPSYTVTGSGGGGTHVYHWSEPRALTNRERARIQTFPDTFVFEGSRESVRRQIGMAVPPSGAAAVVVAVLRTFAERSYDSIDPHWTHEPDHNGQLVLLRA